MALHEPIATHQAGARQLRTYSGDLAKWGGDLVGRYMTAIGFLILGAPFVLVAAGFGVAAIFHVAFAVIGGFFVVVGLIGLATGVWMVRRSPPPVPRPTRKLQHSNARPLSILSLEAISCRASHVDKPQGLG
jgi:hypothetical protein